jgi:WD40 repeat protein
MASDFNSQKAQILSNAERLVQQGKLQSAIAEYNQLLIENPSDIAVLNIVGDLHSLLGNVKEAVNCFVILGDIYSRDGFISKAIAVYKKLIKLEPPSTEILFKFAELHVKAELFTRARTEYVSIAQQSLDKGHTSTASKAFQEILELGPRELEVQKKRKHLEGVISTNIPKTTSEALARADAFLTRNNLTNAIMVLENAWERTPRDVQLTQQLAYLYAKQGRVSESLRTCKILSQLYGSNALPGSDTPEVTSGIEFVCSLQGHTDWIGRIAWSPGGHLLASPSHDGTVRLWDADTGKCLRSIEAHSRTVYTVVFDCQGERLASASDDGTIKIWDPASGNLLRTLKTQQQSSRVLAFDPNGRFLASAGAGVISLWDTESYQLLHNLEGDLQDYRCITFNPKGDVLAAGGLSCSIAIYEFPRGRLIHTLKAHQRMIYGLAFDPKGETLASASADKTLKLWSASSGRLLRTLEGHTGPATGVVFSTDGRVIATQGTDAVRLWNFETGTCVGTLHNGDFEHWPPGLAFHPSRPLLAAVGSNLEQPSLEPNRLIHIWKLDEDLLLRQPPNETVNYTSVKIVLVGESNSGKSYLAHRLVTGSPPKEGDIKSTHGMKIWSLDPEHLGSQAMSSGGQRRDMMLWDMGGQDEYRLVHQLFLHDATLALVLFDPTRGRTAFEEVEAWDKRLESQLHGRPAVKLLIGTKLDEPSQMVDHKRVTQLCAQCGFAGFYETSALNGRGISALREAIANSIDWDGLGKTSRPELFQRIRDEIEERRQKGQVVLLEADLYRALNDGSLIETEKKAIEAVAEHLATQGIIARSRVSTGEPVLVLQVQEIERYAGSLILAARNNPRGVPALELRALAQSNFLFPGISKKQRLSRRQERPVLESTVQLLLAHGICFQHEGLLIFPTLFGPAPVITEAEPALPYSVVLYYDFAGAIDNIYASLVAWLVLARNFGRVRLWADRAELEVGSDELCGLRRIGRPGGFAHLDVYFKDSTSQDQRQLFVSFIEEHLRLHGVDIRERFSVDCPCGQRLEEETLRKRIARGDQDVACPVCEKRHNLTDILAESRQRKPEVARQMWALKTSVEKRKQKSTEQAVEIIEMTPEVNTSSGPIRLLHLSDLHFTARTPVAARLQWLLDDLKQESGLGFQQLDYLVITGDFTDQGCDEGFEKAYEFVAGLTREFALSAERCILVPGNHDLKDIREAYEWRESSEGLKKDEWIKQGDIILARNPEKYLLRLKSFSDGFFHKFLQRPYPRDCAEQGIAIPFWETGLQFLTFNSSWEVDQFHRKRSGLHPEAVARVLREAQKQETEARTLGQLSADKSILRVGVWHHAVAGPEHMKDLDFLGHLQNNGVRIAMHGDVHEMRRELIGYWHARKMHVIGAGSFGSRGENRPESTPRLYNVLEINRKLNSARVHTRCQAKPDGPWKGWNEWPRLDGGKDGAIPYYEIDW